MSGFKGGLCILCSQYILGNQRRFTETFSIPNYNTITG